MRDDLLVDPLDDQTYISWKAQRLVWFAVHTYYAMRGEVNGRLLCMHSSFTPSMFYFIYAPPCGDRQMIQVIDSNPLGRKKDPQTAPR